MVIVIRDMKIGENKYLIFILLAIILFLLILLVYKSPIVKDTFSPETKISYNDSFFNRQEVHFPQMPIKYSIRPFSYAYHSNIYGPINIVGQDQKKEDILTALKIIETSTDGNVYFEKVSWDEADLRIYPLNALEFGELYELEEGREYLFDGTLGVGIYENDGNIIINSSVYFQPKPSSFKPSQDSWFEGRCVDFPHVEVHEILHSLGFFHEFEKLKSIMYPLHLRPCGVNEIDSSLSACLKLIYSNDENEGACASLNIEPHSYNETNITFDDFSWNKLSISYSIFNCDNNQILKLDKTAIGLSNFLGINNFFTKIDGNNSDIVFTCGDAYYPDIYDPDTDYYGFLSGIESDYVFEDDEIKQAKISLNYPDLCKEEGGSQKTPFELIAFYRALGLRNDYGSDMDVLYCAGTGQSYSSLTEERIRELYNL